MKLSTQAAQWTCRARWPRQLCCWRRRCAAQLCYCTNNAKLPLAWIYILNFCHAGKAVDLQGPVVEETALLVAPVRGVAARLAQLLEEWPEHPILSQLAAICGRLLGGGLAVTVLSACKTLLTCRLPERCKSPEHPILSQLAAIHGSLLHVACSSAVWSKCSWQHARH